MPTEPIDVEDHVELVDMPVPGLLALYARQGDDWVVLVDRRLSPAERALAVAHELVHHERGGGCHHPDMPAAWHAVVRRDEHAVERTVVVRAAPMAALRGLVRARVRSGQTVEAQEVAAELDLPVELTRRALELVRDESSSLHPARPRR